MPRVAATATATSCIAARSTSAPSDIYVLPRGFYIRRYYHLHSCLHSQLRVHQLHGSYWRLPKVDFRARSSCPSQTPWRHGPPCGLRPNCSLFRSGVQTRSCCRSQPVRLQMFGSALKVKGPAALESQCWDGSMTAMNMVTYFFISRSPPQALRSASHVSCNSLQRQLARA